MEEHATQPTSNWMIQLDCGHRIELPFGAAVPALPACVVQHQLTCPEFDTFRSSEFASSSSMPMIRGVAYR
ncbi:MAG: hypothetical protein ABSA63_05995 [Thermoplasmata archaeon]|jgi:hypothetical protein